MISKVLSSAVMGLDASLVEVEVEIALGFPQFNTVGLPEGAEEIRITQKQYDRAINQLKKLGLVEASRSFKAILH